ncbi:MAG: AbrB/MazE/SpoVT family DNA-binding domain-containing protein [Acidimicrobiia bacterium]
MSKARMTSKGQLTVPAEIRRALGLERGDTVAFELQDAGALLRPARSPRSLRGALRGRRLDWESARRKAWRARVERLARSSATPTS